jgi:DNA-binding transcriptional LysR family regulator
MSDWRGVSEFVAVVESASFTGAAKRLGLSVAQVSRQVSDLENRLGAKLFYRTTRKVTVTEIAAVYYQHCRSVLDGLADAERAISDLQSSPRGKIKLTAPITYGEESVMPLVNDFVKLYPQLEIDCQLSNHTVDILAESYDLAIRVGSLPDSSMMAKKLSSRRRYVCASPEYLSRYGMPHTLTELDGHNCLTGASEYWRFHENGKLRNVRVAGNIHCNSGYALVDAAVKGLGIIQLPDYYVQSYLERGELLTLLEGYQEPEEGIWALYPHNRHLSPKLKLLLKYLADKLPDSLRKVGVTAAR